MNVLHRSVEITGAKRSFNQARKGYFHRHLPAKSDYWELTSIVQNAEARPLGRKQTFTPRLQGPVYRRRYPVGSFLPYSGSGFDLRINYLALACGRSEGEVRLRDLPIGDSGLGSAWGERRAFHRLVRFRRLHRVSITSFQFSFSASNCRPKSSTTLLASAIRYRSNVPRRSAYRRSALKFVSTIHNNVRIGSDLSP